MFTKVYMISYFRLRLFDDASSISTEDIEAEFESLLTPSKSLTSFNADDTPLSVSIRFCKFSYFFRYAYMINREFISL